MSLHPARPLADIHADAINLAGLAYVLDSFGCPMSGADKTAVAALVAVINPLARKIADDIEGYMDSERAAARVAGL